jgi:biopolymer transport protein ExbD
MRFHRPPKSRNTVQIIPLIDILLVLLIFFIVSTHFKQPRGAMRIELPSSKQLPTEKLTETRSVIAVDAKGNVMLDKVMVPEGLLENYLTAFLKQNPGRRLELEADKALPLEQLLAIWDALTKAGIPIKDVPARIRLPE